MKKGFTLIELLVVTLVIAILASIVFKLTGKAQEIVPRQKTVARMMKLENCISGYYAAFGSYPPVVFYGSRDPYTPVDKLGRQLMSEGTSSQLSLEQIEAACRAQPVAVNFPFNTRDEKNSVKGYSDMIQMLRREDPDYDKAFGWMPWVQNGFDGLETPTQLANKFNTTEWGTEGLCLFRFGLMSYLLPRYLLMMGNSSDDMYEKFAQWFGNNSLPHMFETGGRYKNWKLINDDIKRDDDLNDDKDKVNKNIWKIEMLPSQAVTRRWLPNLEGQCSVPEMNINTKFYGIDVKSTDEADKKSFSPRQPGTFKDWVFATDKGNSQLYMLSGLTVYDGWQNEFYYYSPPPYQSYRLWSAGENKKTFPPWYPPEQLKDLSQQKIGGMTIEEMIADDIVQLSAMR